MEDSECAPENLLEFVASAAAEVAISLPGNWVCGQPSQPANEVLRRFLQEDIPAGQLAKKAKDAARLLCTNEGTEHTEFAALLSGRTSYKTGDKHLGFGRSLGELFRIPLAILYCDTAFASFPLVTVSAFLGW